MAHRLNGRVFPRDKPTFLKSADLRAITLEALGVELGGCQLSPPQARLLEDGNYRDPRVLNTNWAPGEPQMFLSFSDLKRDVANGATFIIDNVGQCSDLLANVIDIVARAIDLRTNLTGNLYWSLGRKSGFGVHADQHDVIAIQLCGHKDWHFPDCDHDDSFCRLEAGGIIFVPRGVRHDVHGTGVHTIHLSCQYDSRNTCPGV